MPQFLKTAVSRSLFFFYSFFGNLICKYNLLFSIFVKPISLSFSTCFWKTLVIETGL